MASNRWPSRPARRTAAHLAARPLAHAVLTLFASLLLILGAAPLALLGPVTTVHAQGGGSLTIKVYEDVGRDGVDSSGTEPGLGGAFVAIYSVDNVLAGGGGTSVTGTLGLANFNLADGKYRVEITPPSSNYVVSIPGAGFTNPGLVFRVTIASAPLNLAVGLRPLSVTPPFVGTDPESSGGRAVTTRVWNDRNANGIQDADEEGIGGLNVGLFDSGGALAATAVVSGSDGLYAFSSVPVLGSYYVRVVNPPAGYTLTKFKVDPSLGGSDIRDSDANITTGQASVPPPALLGVNTDALDIGFAQGSVSGYIFHDVTPNGLLDSGEKRLNGIAVELLDATNVVITTTHTYTESGVNGATGVYRFTSLPAGSYTVRVPGSEFDTGKLLVGAANSPTVVSGDRASPDGVVSTTDGVTIPVLIDFSNVMSGSNRVSDAVFGFYKGSVGDFVWYDLNRDGAQTGETGLGQNDIRVFVDDGGSTPANADNGICDTGELSTTTGLNGISGYYLFDDLPLGKSYTITLDPENFVSGGVLEGINVHPNTAYSGTNSLNQTYYYTVTATLSAVPGNPSDAASDFGLTRSDVGNVVFVDANGNGLFDLTDESRIPGATVTLYRASGINANAPITSMTTDSTGVYTIPNVPAVGYYAAFDLSTAVPTYTNYIASPSTTPVSPTDTLVDYTDVITRLSATSWRTAVFTPALGIANKGVDAGFYLPTTVSGRAFFDTNNDDLDAATPEPGMRGVTVNLHRADALTVVLSTTTTAISDTGAYTFTGVVPGAYVIDFVNPVSDTFALITGTTNVSTTGGVYNSDVVTVTGTVGNTGPVDVTSGTPVKYLDAGFQGRGDVSGRVFLDKNGSDTQDLPDDTNLDNATAALTVTANLPNLVVTYPITPVTTIGSATTNYSFPFLPFGTGVTYTLDFTPPAETPTYMPSAANAVVTDTVDSDGPSLVITQTAATTASQVFDQGYYQEAQVTARVFEEKTSTVNNQYNVGDTGINGVTVTLDLLVAGTAVQTKTTDTTGTGLVTFTVKPGSYQLNIAETASPLTGLVTSPGWTDPVTVTTVLGNGQLFSGDTSATDGLGANSFGYYTPATITGTVFFDRNLNQLKANEPGVAGVGVTLQQGASVVSTTTTTVTGIYTFSGLLPGNYTATFTNPDTGNFAFITGGDSDVTTPGNAATSSTNAITVLYGQPNSANDAGLVGRSAVGGLAFVDANADGSLSTDGGLDGVTVTLSLDVNLPGMLTTQITREVTTPGTATGVYSFTGLPGSGGVLGDTAAYSLTFTAPTATPTHTLMTAEVGDTSLVTDTSLIDSDNELLNQPLTRATDNARDQGYYQDVTVTARVFEEKTSTINNQYNDGAVGDTGLNGVTVTLDLLAGTAVQTQTTDTTGTGLVTFTVPPGAYQLHLDPLASALTGLITSTGWLNPAAVFSTPLSSGTSSATDNTGRNSFGYYKPTTITGTVFFDRNLDNQKANEPGVAGMEVGLNDGTTMVMTTTDATGAYTFTDVLSNSYTLVFTNPDPLNFSFILTGTNPLPNDSAVSPGGAVLTNTINLGQVPYGTNSGNHNAGLVGQSSVVGRTFVDANANGSSENDNDLGLPDATVVLTLDVSLSPWLTTQITRTTITTETAALINTFSFGGLPGGLPGGSSVYTLTFTAPTATPVYTLTTPEVGDTAPAILGPDTSSTDSDNELVGQTLGLGTADSRDQGYYQDATVTARVFEERLGTADNAYQVGDVGLNGVTVTLELLGSTAVQTKTSDATGVVTLTGRPGSYRLNLDPTNVPVGMLASGGFTNPLTLTGNPLLSNGLSATDNAGANSFGYYKPATITGTVFFDGNLDNQKANESGVANVGVTLLQGTTEVSTTTTDTTGAYTFTDVLSNSYTLVFTNPDLLNFSFILTGTNPPNDSAVSPGGAVLTNTINLGQVPYGTNSGNHNAGLVGQSSVSGLVFVDANADGSLSTDVGLAEVTVTLSLDVNIPGTLTTQITREVTTPSLSPTGVYTFAGLPGGASATLGGTAAYNLTFAAPTATPAWQVTKPDVGVPNQSSSSYLTTQPLTVTTQDIRNQGYYQDATVTARVFEERLGTADNAYQVGDVGLTGVTVTLELLGSTAVQTKTTDATGVVTLTGRPGNAYQLRLDPTNVPAGLISSGFTNPVTVTTTPVGGQLSSGGTSLTDNAGSNSFGHYRTATITGTVFFDGNLDNLKANESGVAGVGVTLLRGESVVSTTTTAATGAYTFTDVLSNSYTLVFTNPDTGNFAFVTGGDSAVATPGAMATSTISLGDVTYGTNQPNQDAGLVGRSSVVGRTFVDDNANGSSEDDTDPGLPGATVVLTLDVNLPGLTTQITRSTVTTETAARNNTFSFGGLPGDLPGSSSVYTLTFTAPTATPVWQLTTADAVGVPNASNSDGNLRSLTLLANTAAELDQGYYQDATIVARIFDEQVTVNGVFEPGEVGLSGSTVNINPAASSGGGASDSTGLITYTVKPGVYTVARPAPDPVGFMVSPANPATAPVTVTSGLSAAPLDFGYFKPSTLAGTAWFDTNGNGLLDPDEPGMEAITVTLETGVGDTLGAPVQTDATGAYTITGVTPNTATGAPVDYKLCFSTTTAFTYTLKTGQIADDNNSDVNTAGCTDPFTVRGSNTVSTTTDAGYRGLNSIGDLVWNDLSGDGLQNSTEDGLAGAVVTVAISTTDGLINASNPTLTMTATSSTSTALGANYAVTGVPPAVGFRVVSVTPPLGFIPAPTNQGANDAIDSDPVDYTGGAVPPDVTNLDFGFAAVTTVGDLVWLDLNGNGVYDAASEAGVPDVSVDLLSGTTVVRTTTTRTGAQAGLYAFEGLTPGTYSVRFTAPTGYTFTNNGLGSLATDGDNDARSDGTTARFTLSGGQQLFRVDAGLRGMGGVTGIVWEDTNRNNVRDDTELGRFAGVQVALSVTPALTPNQSHVVTATTATDGSYRFGDLPYGTATISFTTPAKYTPVTANIGDDAFDSDGPVVSVTLTADVPVANVDMGYRSQGSRVFLPQINGRIARAELSGRFTVTPTSPQSYMPAQVTVTVTNTGEAAATNFWVDLYLNPSQVPTINTRWNDICGPTLSPCLGIAWYYTGVLQPGQSVTLISTATSERDPNGYKRDASTWLGYFLDGTSKLYVLVDSWNRDASGTVANPNGAVDEQNEQNNLIEQNLTVTAGTPLRVNADLLHQPLSDRPRSR